METENYIQYYIWVIQNQRKQLVLRVLPLREEKLNFLKKLLVSGKILPSIFSM